MTDFGPGKDRISIPDSRAKTLEALRDTGVHGGFDRWSDAEDQETVEQEGGVPLGHDRSSVKDGGSYGRGGGEGGYELLVEDPTSNPEMGSLLKDFLREKHADLITEEGDFPKDEVLKLGKEFDKWQDSDSTEEEWENAPREQEKFKKSEERQKTQELNEKMLKEKQDGDFVHLEVIPKALEKFATEDEAKTVLKFQDIWKKGNVAWIGFEIGKSKENFKVREIKDIGIGVKGADERIDYTRISAHLARKVFNGIDKSNKPGTDIITGLAFINPFSKKREVVYPGVRVDQVAEIMRKVKLGGKMLPDNVKFFIGNEYQKSE